VENPVSVGLKHFCVRVETRVSEISDLSGEKLDSVGGIAEDDGLVDLQLLVSIENGRKERDHTLENSVLRQWTLSFSST
jgi:hypothetical protein